MTQPYGQQPDGGYQQGGGNPQGGNPQGGYPQTPGQGQPAQSYPQSPPYGQPAQNYPQSPAHGYPQQAFGAMPAAPPEYSQGPIARPGVATTAAVLAFVQAGITLIPAIMQFIDAADGGGGQAGNPPTAVLMLVALAEVVGAVLLIAGAVQLLGGKSRTMLIIGAAIELVLCGYWIIFAITLDFGLTGEGADVAMDVGRGVLIGFAIFLAVMPTISLVMSVGATTTQFLQSRRGR